MNTDRKAIGHIAKAAGMRALVLNYRRSPEHKFPAQIDAGRVPEVDEAIAQISEWLRSKLGLARLDSGTTGARLSSGVSASDDSSYITGTELFVDEAH
jgi:hypothetical protein